MHACDAHLVPSECGLWHGDRLEVGVRGEPAEGVGRPGLDSGEQAEHI